VTTEELQEFEIRLDEWLGQGYHVMADELEGELLMTGYFVPFPGEVGREREQEFWPLKPEILELLERRGVSVAHSLVEP